MSAAVRESRTREDRDLRGAREIARTLIARHFGGRPTRVVNKAFGKTNFVFDVTHRDGRFIVRLNPSPDKHDTFMKERWAIGKGRSAGVPTPEVLAVGLDEAQWSYMISRHSAGHAASRRVERLDIIRDMGRCAALINSIDTVGFGADFDRHEERLAQRPTVRKFLADELRVDARLETLRAAKMLSDAQIAEIGRVLEELETRPSRPVLIHGDLRLKNVILDEDGKIQAIIDWEHCLSGIAPAWELSTALHDLSIDEKEAFIAGYGLPRDELEAAAPLMKALNLINYAPIISKLIAAGDTSKLEEYRTRLRGTLDMYSLPSM